MLTLRISEEALERHREFVRRSRARFQQLEQEKSRLWKQLEELRRQRKEAEASSFWHRLFS